MNTLVTPHLRLGDVVVLLVLVLALAGALYRIGALVTRPTSRRRTPAQRLAPRIATSIVVRHVARGVDRMGRGFSSWN